jgi:alanine racemase
MTALNEPATDELRPTYVEVRLDVLADNYRAIAAHVTPASVMPILKANAYGHGLVEVGRVVERLGAP